MYCITFANISYISNTTDGIKEGRRIPEGQSNLYIESTLTPPWLKMKKTNRKGRKFGTIKMFYPAANVCTCPKSGI